MKKMLSAFVTLFMVATANAGNPVIVMETSMGTVKIELFEDKSPITVKNFLGYVDDKFYDGTIFHRVMGKENSAKDFVIQGGGWMLDANVPLGMKEKPGAKPPIKNEAANGVKNQRGTIAMARTAEPDTATSQFYINVVDNPKLDKEFEAKGIGYCAFGKVLEGMEVVDKIKAVKVTRKNEEHTHVPTEPIVIKSIKRTDEKIDEKKPDEKKEEKKPS